MGPDYVVDFPTLFVAVEWIEAHCVVPDGFDRGEFLYLGGQQDWQSWFLLNHYRVRPAAKRGQRAPAFHNRRSQLVLPQKAGKSPLLAAQICLEARGPALFAGWAGRRARWRCADHGCPCGWAYEYEAGEAMGMLWPTPLIQITAFSEDQTDNVHDALRPMIELGPLAEVIPKTGEEFIRIPGGGRIDTVTSSHRSRLGQRVTFAPQIETGLWTGGLITLAETQRRGLAGMSGRAVEESNAWDPAEDSVAQRTAESGAPDLFRFHPLPPANLSYTNKRERRKIHRFNYAGSPWVDLDAIEAEAAELLPIDPVQAERFFGNRPVPGGGQAYNTDRWAELADPAITVPERSLITIGVDGDRFDDALAIVATDVEQAHQWVLGTIWEVPPNAPDDYEHPQDEIDAAMVEAFDLYDVWRVYVDPAGIEHLRNLWRGRWGEKRVVNFETSRFKPMAFAVRRHVAAVHAGDLSHDGDPVLARHIGNAAKRKVSVRDERRRQMWVLAKDRPDSPRKIDGAPAAVLSWEARGDAIAAGARRRRKKKRRRVRARLVEA